MLIHISRWNDFCFKFSVSDLWNGNLELFPWRKEGKTRSCKFRPTRTHSSAFKCSKCCFWTCTNTVSEPKKPVRTKWLRQRNTIIPSKILSSKGCFIKRHCSSSITPCSLTRVLGRAPLLLLGGVSLQPPSCAGSQPCRRCHPRPGELGSARTTHSHHHILPQPSWDNSTASPFLVSCKNPAIRTFLCEIRHGKTRNAKRFDLVYGWNICCLLLGVQNKHDTDTLPCPSSRFIVVPQNDAVGMVSFPSSLG